MNSLLSRPAVSSASLRSRNARSTRAVSVTSRQVSSTLPSGSGTVASCKTEPSRRSSGRSVGACAVMRAMIRSLHRRPVAAIVIEGAGLLDDLADMRLAGEIGLATSPRSCGRPGCAA